MFEDRKRFWHPVVGGALFLLVFLSAYSLELTYWTFDLDRIVSIAFWGIIFGFLIGISKFTKKYSILLACLYGLVIFFYRFVFSLSDEANWAKRFFTLVDRFKNTFGQITQNIPLDDGIFFLLLMAVFFCVISLSAGYSFTRNGNPSIPVGILTVFFFTIQFYISPYYRKYSIIIVFNILVVLLFGRLFYLHEKEKWVKYKYKEDNETGSLFTQSVLIISLIFTVITRGIPFFGEVFSLNGSQYIYRSKRETSESWERVRNFFYPLRTRVGFGDDLFTEILPLGAVRSLDESPVFDVQIGEGYKYPDRYYWKARTYALYLNGFWENDLIEVEPLNQIDLNPYLSNTFENKSYQFTYYLNRKEIITPQVVSDMEGNAEVAFYPINENQQDVMGGYYEAGFEDGASNSRDYPQWVKERYLSLPDEFGEKLEYLTKSVTLNESTVLDRVVAVTDYLRTSLQYSDEIIVPADADPVDWFLFDGREGFCNYFASAEVLMLRSIGIPSRLVVGYAQGEQNQDNRTFSVRKIDSHSWVEVFFPNEGWVIFEPTPSQPPVEYSQVISAIDGHQLTNNAGENGGAEGDFITPTDIEGNRGRDRLMDDSQIIIREQRGNGYYWLILAIVLILLLMSVVHGVFLREKPIQMPIIIQNRLGQNDRKIPHWLQFWADYEQLSLIEKNFQVIKTLASLLRLLPEKKQTPAKFLEDLFRLIQLDDKPGDLFITLYHKQKYSRKPAKYQDDVKNIYLLILRLIIKQKLVSLW